MLKITRKKMEKLTILIVIFSLIYIAYGKSYDDIEPERCKEFRRMAGCGKTAYCYNYESILIYTPKNPPKTFQHARHYCAFADDVGGSRLYDFIPTTKRANLVLGDFVKILSKINKNPNENILYPLMEQIQNTNKYWFDAQPFEGSKRYEPTLNNTNKGKCFAVFSTSSEPVRINCRKHKLFRPVCVFDGGVDVQKFEKPYRNYYNDKHEEVVAQAEEVPSEKQYQEMEKHADCGKTTSCIRSKTKLIYSPLTKVKKDKSHSYCNIIGNGLFMPQSLNDHLLLLNLVTEMYVEHKVLRIFYPLQTFLNDNLEFDWLDTNKPKTYFDLLLLYVYKSGDCFALYPYCIKPRSLRCQFLEQYHPACEMTLKNI